MPIKIIVDSASDITKEEAKLLGIEVIPMEITIGDELFLDGYNLSTTQFYEKLVESDVLPKTSQITPYRYEQTYKKYVNDGYEVIVITLSSKLSATYNSALQASKKFNGKVKVVDSLNAAIGERLVVLLALDLIKQGKNIKEIVDTLDIMKHRINVIAVVDTLEYLKKGGRISKTVAFIGGVLTIKPVVGIVDGKVKVLGKARGSKKAKNMLTELITQKGGIDFSLPFGAVYSGLTDVYVKKYVEDSRYLWEKEVKEVPIHLVGCTIGTHVGPGAIGVAFFQK